jgi:hypothetical protein
MSRSAWTNCFNGIGRGNNLFVADQAGEPVMRLGDSTPTGRLTSVRIQSDACDHGACSAFRRKP